ncbi:hypothetical protein Mal48_17110 [Thalassoglobus polymorphus]|uniref:Cell division protein FtsL n=2 Tax=Thalassoglobus polymorphus TaxID=2527994 RepID=A0A517QLE9_9PLAN|nr:hypothetical protein Mal48_17110 [Thalassoglobus polymorphus]
MEGATFHGESMFFRFAATLAILTLISIMGIALEKQKLSLKRAISEQHYQLQALAEERSQLFLKTQQLGAPPRLLREWNSSIELTENRSVKESSEATPPLLEWRLKGAGEERRNE